VPAIQRGLASGKPSIINVQLDPEGIIKADALRPYVM